MAATQLQLPGFPPPRPTNNAQVRTRSKPLALALDHHRAAIQHLLHGPAPLAQVARMAGATCEQKLVDELRDLGLDVETVPVPSPGDGDGTPLVTVCSLTKRDTRKVLHYIKRGERGND